MDNNLLRALHEEQGRRKIKELARKIDVTKYNIEAAEDIISHTPSNAQRDKLTQKNNQRRHAVGALQKEIQDIEQTMAERERERS